MRELKDNPLIPPLLLVTFFSMLAYLPLIPNLGFYSDDFFFSYIAHFYGSEGILKSLVVDRPFNGYLLVFNYFVLGLGDNVFLWHLFIFAVRLLGGYILFFILRKIWPNKLSVVTSVTLLFLLYPGFLQQVLPLGFINYITTLTLWIVSLAFSILAVKSIKQSKYIIFTLFALIFQVNAFLQVEFFIGMEVLRILIISYTLENKISFKSIKKTVYYWSPYLIALTLFVLWRIFLFKGTRETTDIGWVTQTYYSNPLWIAKIPLELLYSFMSTVFFAYFIPIFVNFVRLPLENSIISLILGIATIPFLYSYYKKIENSKVDKDLNNLTPTKRFCLQVILIGLITIFASLIPIIISGRFVRLFNVFDRYTITSIIGVGLVLVGFIFFKISISKRKWIMILLVTVSITSHLMNGYWHKIIWDKQKDLWWQLYWRAPKIENNAMLILDFPPIAGDIPFREILNKLQWYRFYWAEEQIWTAGNLFFNYNNPPNNHFHGDFLADSGVVEKVKEGSVEILNNRNIIYTRDFKNSIIITAPSDVACLRILDGDKLIKAEPSFTPPEHIFGNEPPHAWCYFFQKASLARQLKDWDQLSRLKEEVIKKGLKPKDPNEWLPFQKDLR